MSWLERAARGSVGAMTPGELRLLIDLGLVVPKRVTEDGRVTEYELTHAGRTLVATEKRRWS